MKRACDEEQLKSLPSSLIDGSRWGEEAAAFQALVEVDP